MLKLISLLCCAAILTGCIDQRDIVPGGLARRDLDYLCDNWLAHGRYAYLEEIRRRQLFDEVETKAIAEHGIHIGLSEAAARCSWGTAYRVHVTNVGSGEQYQWAYEDAPSEYVYVAGGKVTAYQN